MSESYELTVIDLPGGAQTYVRKWDTGLVEVDYRPFVSSTWLPIDKCGGSFHIEKSLPPLLEGLGAETEVCRASAVCDLPKSHNANHQDTAKDIQFFPGMRPR